ncbi:hypothetical protein C7B82_28515 [Stenomitos frigidus ULC18]|uniref:Major facilitator superfamily (MFS) profile domain-containing protein n=2 Tax=Stenomitos TaxID=1844270 RepID=A0A2T1DU96_9CYAN|nr:hypothetical protein C7B82_28515 [Stenomitos frigidus ULC18]
MPRKRCLLGRHYALISLLMVSISTCWVDRSIARLCCGWFIPMSRCTNDGLITRCRGKAIALIEASCVNWGIYCSEFLMPIPITANSQTRWRLPVVLAVTVFINYLDRNNLALALPRLAQDFGWSDREVGAKGEWLLAAFFLAYALSNMLLSPVAERFGPKRSVMVAISAFSLVTLLSALWDRP